jgi:polyphosphate:AMP phosphotransferase
MFRTAELGRKVPKREFKEREIILRQRLLEIQQSLRGNGQIPVIILFAGVDGAGKGETVNLLNEWMDPRWLVTSAYGEPSDEELERPEYWRFWRDLPPKGRIGLFLSSWYSRPVLEKVYDSIDVALFDKRLERIIAFENALADEGALILKFWMHLSRKAQKKRLKGLERDPLLRWRVTDRDWKHWRLYDDFLIAAERTIMRTSTGTAPWSIVEGADPNYRSLTVGTIVHDAIRKRLDEISLQEKLKSGLAVGSSEPQTVSTSTESDDAIEAEGEGELPTGSAPMTILDSLDMSQRLNKQEYKASLKEYQARLNQLSRKALKKKTSVIMVFEGPDAAGKGGAIRRLTAALDARNYQVIPIAAPTDEERAHHYLWRFWRHIGRAGRFTIYDRSWYGRVLVERVEGFATEAQWRRAYAEINDFEEQLIEHGIVLLKYWIHITKEEQLERFRAREQTPHKRWKLTEEDWRNRDRWDDYALSVNDMVEHTSTRQSPWVLVEGNNKLFSRIKVIKTLCEKLEVAVK